MKKKVMWIVTFIPLIVTLWVIKYLPSKVPMHYDIYGNIDRWGSRYEQLIFPVVMIFISAFMQAIIHMYEKSAKKCENDKKKAEILSNVNVLYIVNTSMVVMFMIMQCVFLYQAWEATPDTREQTMDMGMIMPIIMGIMFIICGNYMPKTRRNGVIGFRVAATMKSDENWAKGNKFAGKVFVIAGIITVILAFVIDGNVAMAISPILLMIAVMVCMIYANGLE